MSCVCHAAFGRVACTILRFERKCADVCGGAVQGMSK